MDVCGMINCHDLAKKFGQVTAVDHLELAVNAGEIYGLVGPDGAGKTTTLRLLCGALKPDKGRIQIGSFELLKHMEAAREIIGYLPQRFSLYEDLTVLENIRFFAEVRGIPSKEWLPRCLNILEFVGLVGFRERLAGQLSGGMKQKLGLAAALIHRPRVLLLDEPTTGVDPVTRQDFWQLIIRLASDENAAILVTTPYMDEAARCTRLGFMVKGNLIVEGTPAYLLQDLLNRLLEIQGKPLWQVRRLALEDPDVEDAQMFGDRLHVRVKSGTASGVSNRLVQKAGEQDVLINQIREVVPQLEDAFMVWIGKGQGG